MWRHLLWAAGAWALCLPSSASALPQSPQDADNLLVVPAAEAQAIRAAPFAAQCVGTQLTTVGRVTYDAMRVAPIVSPVSGRIERVVAQLGDTLASQAPLATIDSPDFATARADWHKAQVARDAARRDLQRQDGLYKRHAAPEQVVLGAWDAYRRAQSEWERARGNISLLGGLGEATGSNIYTLRTPLAGVVVSRHVHPGMEVSGVYGGGGAQELFLVADLSRVWIIAEVPEADLGHVAPHAHVTAHVDAFPQSPLEGVLDYVADTLDPVTHTAHVRSVMPNPQGKLKPDMFVTLTIDAAEASALAVAKESVVHLGDTTFVYVEHVDNNEMPTKMRTFERRHVIVDENSNGALWPVHFGLQLGDRIVTEGAAALAARHAEVAP